jgi:diaminopimelate decarboxylase
MRPCLEMDPREGLLFAGVPVNKLAKEYGTPLYVYSEDAIRDSMREYTSALSDICPDSAIVYASKAYLTMRMANLADQEGLWIDVASGGELYIAQRAGFPLDRIVFHGNNKSLDEISMAVSSGVGRIAVDNTAELERIQAIAAQQGVVQPVFLRLTPGIDPHTHRYLSTGEIHSKFGIPMHRGEHMEAVRQALHLPNVKLTGIHCHIGSQIFDDSPFELAAEAMVKFMSEVRDALGYTIPELDLGGGLGVTYSGAPQSFSVRAHLRNTARAVHEKACGRNLPPPRLFFEPGRSIVAASAVTLYTVGTIKKLPDGVLVAAVDGGMSDNPRPVLYGTEYDAVLARSSQDPTLFDYRIVGKHCEEGDTIIDSAKLPMLTSGDIIAVPVSGAYQYSMRSNYNALPNPAVVHIADKRPFTVVRRQTYADLVANEEPLSQSSINRGGKAANGG